MAGHVERKFQAAPNSELVERAAQVVLDYLLGGADVVGDFAIGETLPNQGRHLRFFAGQLITGLHRGSLLSGTWRWQALRVCARQ